MADRSRRHRHAERTGAVIIVAEVPERGSEEEDEGTRARNLQRTNSVEYPGRYSSNSTVRRFSRYAGSMTGIAMMKIPEVSDEYIEDIPPEICPRCHQATVPQIGVSYYCCAHVCAIIMCFFFLCFCSYLPYCSPCCLKLSYYCEHCGAFMGSKPATKKGPPNWVK